MKQVSRASGVMVFLRFLSAAREITSHQVLCISAEEKVVEGWSSRGATFDSRSCSKRPIASGGNDRLLLTLPPETCIRRSDFLILHELESPRDARTMSPLFSTNTGQCCIVHIAVRIWELTQSRSHREENVPEFCFRPSRKLR